MSAAGRAPVYSRKFVTLVLFWAAGMAGCSGGPTPQQQLDEAFKDSKAKRLEVVPFQGTVTIDGQHPADNVFLCVVLMDAEKYKDPKVEKWMARVDNGGHFSFMTYLSDDGVPVGKYVACFVDPTDPPKANRTGNAAGSGIYGASHGDDKLKNLYNDPEVNLKKPEFVIDVRSPGITNQTFDLQVAGKEAPPAPGQYAVVKVR
jgi:hypothetical protein